MHATLPGKSPQSGILAALGALLLWGCLPVYWKTLQRMGPLEIMCHRMLWSFLTMLPVIVASGMLGQVLRVVGTKKLFLGLMCSGFTLAGNWLLFIWAVNSGMVLEASLGYYINPLLNILLGVVFFQERAGRVAWVAIGIAAASVLFQAFSLGHMPWVALGLGVSFTV